MNIYTQTVPYFYIIRNKETGIMYAGAKWKDGCHPNTFMKEDGYQTSSSTINSFIEEFGIDIFEILRIDTYCDGLHPYDYETLFLQTNNCASSDEWYNRHNNSRISFGTKDFYKIMKQKYGVKHCSELKYTSSKRKETCIKRYGVDNPSKSSEIKKLKNRTSLYNWGVSEPLSSEIIISKGKQTKLKKYDDENYNNTSKNKQTKLEKYGNENYNNRNKSKETCIELYGEDSPLKNKGIKDQIKETNKKLYGVEFYTQVKAICPWCGKFGQKVGMTPWHFDKCKLNPNKI